MSDRTLKRQLAAEGTSFSTLVDEVRYRHRPLCFRVQIIVLNKLQMNLVTRMSQISVALLNAGAVAVRATGAKTPIYNVIKILDTSLRSCHEPSFRIEVCTYT